MSFEIIKSKFSKDIMWLLLLTIFLGSMVSLTASRVAYTYFNKAISGLIGTYGEYDIIVHIKSDYNNAAIKAINDLFKNRYTGSKVKIGVAVAGNANYLVAFPRGLYKRETFESLSGALNSIPGYNGYTVITEPRISISGIPSGFSSLFTEDIKNMDGVLFFYVNDQSIEVILTTENARKSVEYDLRQLLARYKIVEARFSMGVEFPDVTTLTDKIVMRIRRSYGVVSQDISLGNDASNNYSLIKTLNELKSFLLNYTTSILLDLDVSKRVEQGDYLVLSKNGMESGNAIGTLPLARVYGSGADGIRAILIKGDIAALLTNGTRGNLVVNLVDGGDPISTLKTPRAGKRIGIARVWMQRNDLLKAIKETKKGLVGFNKSIGLAEVSLNDTIKTLSSYDKSLSTLTALSSSLTSYENQLIQNESVYENLDTGSVREIIIKQSVLANKMLGSYGNMWETYNVSKNLEQNLLGVRDQLSNSASVIRLKDNTAAKSIQNQVNRLSQSIIGISKLNMVLITNLNSDKQSIDDIKAFVKTVPDLLLALAGFNSEAQRIVRTRNTVRQVSVSLGNVITTLSNIDILALRRDLELSLARVKELQKIDTVAILDQIAYLENSLPRVSDIDIGRSLLLLDSYLAGQVIPGERIVILTASRVPDDYVARVIQSETKERLVSIISTSAGEVQSDVRVQIISLLRQVKAIVAAFATLLITMIVMATDHATVLSAQRIVSGYKGQKQQGYSSMGNKMNEIIYGGGVGFIIAYPVGLVSGAYLLSMPTWAVGILGLLIGIWVAVFCDKISPVDGAEMIAGEAMGFTIDEVMRQIVLPNKRIGLLAFMNRRNVRL